MRAVLAKFRLQLKLLYLLTIMQSLSSDHLALFKGKFRVGDYLKKQPQITKEMRAVLADWMVEVQENFELNHETLYLAVKLTDLYLDKVLNIGRDDLQLIASTAIFIASKFDVRFQLIYVFPLLLICTCALMSIKMALSEGAIFSRRFLSCNLFSTFSFAFFACRERDNKEVFQRFPANLPS